MLWAIILLLNPCIAQIQGPCPELISVSFVMILRADRFEFDQYQGQYKLAGQRNGAPYYEGTEGYIHLADTGYWYFSPSVGSPIAFFYALKSTCPTNAVSWYKYSRETSEWIEFLGFSVTKAQPTTKSPPRVNPTNARPTNGNPTTALRQTTNPTKRNVIPCVPFYIIQLNLS